MTTTSERAAPRVAAELRELVWQVLRTVLDPELDEPITDLNFVDECTVTLGDSTRGAHVRVGLRLPTFFCAPNFSFLMVADAYDAVKSVAGVSSASVALADHHASREINEGVAAHAGFVASFEDSDQGEAIAELDELRHLFLAKAALAGQDRVAQPLVDTGVGPEHLAALTLGKLSGTVADTVELQRLRSRRASIGLPADDDAPLLLHLDGSRVTAAQVPLHLRRARLQRVGIETNGQYCKSLLKARYEPVTAHG